MARRTLLRVGVSAVLVLTSTAVLRPAAAQAVPGNSVVTWDGYAQQAIWDVAQQQPNEQARSFAMVHGAVYDAVNAIAGTPYRPYLVAPVADGTESADAAVAAAAYQMLVSLFPSQQTRLLAQYDAALAAIADGPSKPSGVAVGEQAAAAMIAARENDGAFGTQTWVTGTQPGQWRPTPPTFASAGAWTGHVRPFLMPDAAMFRTSGPPALTSRAYAKDFNEVKKIGGATSMVRTPDQTEAAIWWHDRRLTEWEIKRQVAVGQGLNTLQAARMFAMVDMTEADALIACYAEKEYWSFWRPVTAVQLGDADGNPATTGDPTWMPLLVTPPFPDYTSGHTCFTSASMATLAYFYHRDDIAFSAYSPAANATRHFRSFSQALAEVVEARIWGGIHFRSADNQGVRIGLSVFAYMIAGNAFKPRK
ncbi:MAG: vanadium-dependent haloperoxidase [Hamadaea sp.]|uniref:vanadium-dependent haloperoxidase n=1 Tax=Hamadaea sp. TaxID=2024425 RepID=UPI0018069102|nr:vanadium-dependent haloperoxidase [Hamadaea sp.]NUT21786.1 vanadium-dependent haloperoxidase [Hamadaea sp.]